MNVGGSDVAMSCPESLKKVAAAMLATPRVNHRRGRAGSETALLSRTP